MTASAGTRMAALTKRLKDPGHVLLRRAARVAVVLPAVYWFVQFGLGWTEGSLYAAFAVFSILTFADFGGPTFDRLRANLTLSLTGVALVLAGSVIGQWRWWSVVATFVVVFTISYASVLRGYFVAASTAAMVPFILAVTSPPELAAVPLRCGGWAIGAAAATLAALVLWPAHPRSLLRRRLADTLDCASDAVRELMAANTPAGHAVAAKEISDLLRAVDDLHGNFDGRLARPGSGTARDRSLLLAIDELHRLRTVLRVWLNDEDVVLQPHDLVLGTATADTLSNCAAALRRGSGETEFKELGEQREIHEEWMVSWASDEARTQAPAALRSGLESSFHLRVASMTTQVLAFYVQGALDTRDRKIATRAKRAGEATATFGDKTVFDPRPQEMVGGTLAAQFTIESPWMRTALRTALALAVTVLVVLIVGLEHGFWVSLGALVALKFDASGTRRTATEMVVGTIGGFVVGSILVFLVGPYTGLYWVLLPISVFLAAYTPGAISLAVGQASFAIFVISLFGITDPRRFQTGEIRLIDVTVGVVIALVVSMFMWPRGITPLVRVRLRSGLDATSNFLVVAIHRYVEGAAIVPQVAAAEVRARHESDRADETFDLAISQGGPDLVHLPAWITIINVIGQLEYAAAVLAKLHRVAPLPPECQHVGRSIEAAAALIRDRMLASMDQVQAGPDEHADPGRLTIDDAAITEVRAAIDEDVATLAAHPGPDFGRAVVAITFAGAWLAQCAWMTDRLAARALGEEAPASELIT